MVNEITAGTKCKQLLITIQLAQAVPVSFNQNIHSDINFHYGTYTTHFIHSGSSTKRQTEPLKCLEMMEIWTQANYICGGSLCDMIETPKTAT